MPHPHIAMYDNSGGIVKCLVDGGASLESRDMATEWLFGENVNLSTNDN